MDNVTIIEGLLVYFCRSVTITYVPAACWTVGDRCLSCYLQLVAKKITFHNYLPQNNHQCQILYSLLEYEVVCMEKDKESSEKHLHICN